MRFTSYVHIVNGEVREIAYDNEVSGWPDFGLFDIDLTSKAIVFDDRDEQFDDDCYLKVHGSMGSYGWTRVSDNVTEGMFGRKPSRIAGKPYAILDSSGHETIALNGTPSFSATYYKGSIASPTEVVVFLITSAPVQWEILPSGCVVPWPYGTDHDIAMRFNPSTMEVTLDTDCLNNPEFSFPGLDSRLGSTGVRRSGRSVTFNPFSGQVFRIGRELYLYAGGTMYKRTMVGVTLEATNLRCEGFHNKTGERKVFLRDASLTVHPGEIVAIIGESGGGKSTLLKALCGFCEASGGSVTLNGTDLYDDESLRSALGYLPQADLLNESLTVGSELSYQAKLKCPREYDSKRRATRIRELLRRFSIEGERDNRIGPLSGGQKKRVAIAAALLSEPSVLFLDEPTSPLDPGMSGEFVRETLVEVSRGGCSVVFVTHDMDTLVTADRVVWVHENHIEWDGTLLGLMDAAGTKDLTELASRLFGRKVKKLPKHYESHTLSRSEVRPDISIRSYLKRRIGKYGQFALCARRSAELLVSNPSSALMVAMPVVIGLLMGVVSNGDKMYDDYTFTKSMLFTFSAGAFFVGVFDSIQAFSRREHLAVEQYHGLSTTAYALATLLVQTVVCAAQTALLTGMFAHFSPHLDRQIFSTIWDLYFTAFLCCESAMCMGLAASAAVRRASSLAPVLVLMQIIFSGIIFPMDGMAKKLSYFISCRWAVTSLGVLSDLNSLKYQVPTEEAAAAAAQTGSDPQMYSVIHDEPMYAPEVTMFLRGWIWMALISLILLTATLVVLKRRERSQYRIVGLIDPTIAAAKRFGTAYSKFLVPACLALIVALLALGGAHVQLFGMLRELGSYLVDVAGRLPEALSPALEDFVDVFFPKS